MRTSPEAVSHVSRIREQRSRRILQNNFHFGASDVNIAASGRYIYHIYHI